MSGDAGVGKTVLLDAAATHATAAGTRVVRAAGAEFEADLSFAALNQVLYPLLGGLEQLSALHGKALRGRPPPCRQPGRVPGRLPVGRGKLLRTQRPAQVRGRAARRTAAALIGDRFPALAPRVRQRLLADAQGNPLALLELPIALSCPQRAGALPSAPLPRCFAPPP